MATINFAARTATVTDLSNGTAYTFTIRATNAAGTSSPSNASNSVIPTANSNNTNLEAIPGDKVVYLSWDSYEKTVYYKITTYQYDDDVFVSSDTVYNDTETTIYGLTNGVSYYFTVQSFNGEGDSLNDESKSDPVTPTAPNIVPNAPTNVIATAGNTTANLSWTAPTSNGGTDISSYTVFSSPSGGIATINFAARTASVTDLSNGTAYTFTVVATNAVGDSNPSNASNSVTPTAPNIVPNAPTSVIATAGN
ncbi:MAG: hypothetical protein EBZ62_06770, partial [Sphingobacteriia bacterium]|nr:hypothetical protein [Sphingobacteriia bacterium]